MKKYLVYFLFFLITCSNSFATGDYVDDNDIGLIDSSLINNNIDDTKLSCKNIKDVLKNVFPAVVEIKSFKTKKEKINNSNDTLQYIKSMDLFSVGSGFMIDSNGYILTNSHVVEDADKIVVYSEGKEYKAEFIGGDFYTDVALLKINKNDSKYLELNPEIQYLVGDDIIIIGNPHGLGISISKGIISAKNRSMETLEFFNLIQIDANINRGNSGGPLLNCNGDVIGLNTMLYSDNEKSHGIAFAIPISSIMETINKLKDFGYVQRGWLGIHGVTIDDSLLTILNSKRSNGVFIVDVINDSPADKSGLLPSDVIVSYDDKTISTVEQLINMIRNTSIGSNVNILVLRNGKYIKIRTKITDSPENSKYSENNINSLDFMDMTVAEINDYLIKKYKLYKYTKGMYVVDVKNGGFAEYYGINIGDTIISINQIQINSKEDYKKAVNDLKNNKEFLMIVNKKDKGNIVLKLNYNLIN